MTDHFKNSSMIEILHTLHEGGRIDQFSSGKVYLTNIFGELINFPAGSFELLIQQQFIQRVHLHLPGGKCYKISTSGLDRIDNQHTTPG